MASALVQFRVEESTKTQAASICEQLGIDLPTYLRMCMARLVRDNGIPFSMVLETPAKPLAIGELTKSQLDEEIARSMESAQAGRLYAIDAVEAEALAGLER